MAKKPATPKLTAAAVEATAVAFLAAFKTLPSKVKGRFVELLDDYEDELNMQELVAAQVANSEDFDPANSLLWEQVKAEMNARRAPTKAATSQREAA